MSLTVTEIETAVKRATGRTDPLHGDTDIAQAVLQYTNDCITEIAHKYDIDPNRRQYSSTITTADYIFSLPSTTDDATILSVKSILGAWLEIDNTGEPLHWLTVRRKDDDFPHTDSETGTGQPCWIGIQDETYFFVDPYPDQSYTIHMRCSVFPVRLHSSGQQHPYPPVWDEAVAAGVIYRFFRAMQEPDDARFWRSEYDRKILDAYHSEQNKPAWTPRQTENVGGGGNPPGYPYNPWRMGRLR